jgi:hypothetical protein
VGLVVLADHHQYRAADILQVLGERSHT